MLQHKSKSGEPFSCYMCDFETESIDNWINHTALIYSCVVCGFKIHENDGNNEESDDSEIDDQGRRNSKATQTPPVWVNLGNL